MSEITEYEQGQIDEANTSGKTPVVDEANRHPEVFAAGCNRAVSARRR